ncbi:MAG: hypothetical protein J6L73_01795 [Muribaculaceae bacterium]|nr:hypothetical protein [Muribaculaceae bacterium]
MKYLNIISGLALILLLAAGGVKAQRYVADNIYNDSIQVYEVRMHDGKEFPGEFADDMDLYYNVLATAAKNGVWLARDIIDKICEPENCQEED